MYSPEHRLELIPIMLDKYGVSFSKTVAAKLVGGEGKLERLVLNGKIRMSKPTEKQNGKWFCNAGDVIKNMKL